MTSMNETNKPVQFEELANGLIELGGDGHPSEIHGYLCGLLCAGSRPSLKSWLVQVAEQLGDKTLDKQSEQLLTQLFNTTLEQLESGSLAATMLVPDDDDALELRTESLGVWCQTFISGFGQGLKKQDVSKMVEEVLRDFAEISLIEAAESTEDSEKLYMEVSEFVRMAWLSTFAEVNGLPEAKSDKGGTLH